MGRVLGAVVLVVVALAALLVGSTFTLLRTTWGGDLARRVALPRVNRAIAGRLELDRFTFGGDRLSMTGVRLRDPEGRVVVRVRAVDVTFSPLALVRGRVRVRSLSIAEPALYLRTDPSGLNLARALAARGEPNRKPKAADDGSAAVDATSGGLKVDVETIALSDGSVELGGVPPVASPRRILRVVGLAVGGHAHYETGTAAFVVSLEAGARVQEPLKARFDLRIAGHGRGERRDIDLRGSLGESALAAEGHTDTGGRASLRVLRLHATPEVVTALAPEVTPVVPLDLTADLTRTGAMVAIAAQLKSLAGRLNAQATVDTAAARVGPFVVTAQDVDLGGLIAGLPRSSLSLTATGQGSGRDLQRLSGAVTLDLPAGQVGGLPVGPIAVRAVAEGGQYDVQQLRAVLPGLTIVGHGPAGPARMALRISVDASDLGLTSRTLLSFPGPSLPSFNGHGRLELSLSGTTRAPAVGVSARFSRLGMADARVSGLTLEARIPDARVLPTASAELRVVEARVAGRRWRRATVRVRSDWPRLVAHVSLGGPTPVSLTAAGTWGPDHLSFELDRFRLQYPEAAWTMFGRTLLSWRSDRLALTGLDLRSGRQRLGGSLVQRGSRLHVKLDIRHLDLGRLPRAALPPALVLDGLLDLHGELRGRTGGGLTQPDVRVTASLRDGRLGHHGDLAADLAGSYRAGRVAGHLHARGLGTSVRARFDLPTVWPIRDSSEPVVLEVAVPETDLQSVLTAVDLHLDRRIEGRVGLALDLHGTGRAPHLRFDATGRSLLIDGQRLGDVRLSAAGDAGSPLVASVDVGPPGESDVPSSPAAAAGGSAPGCSGAIEARTTLSLAALAHGLPTGAELMRTRFDVTGDLRGIPLPTLARLARYPAVTGGIASIRMSASGTARAPQGALNVELAGATGPRFPPTDARLDAAFAERDSRVALRVVRQGRALLSASGVLGLGAHRLDDVAALAAVPVTVTATLGPLRLHRDAIPGALDLARSGSMSADLRADLSIDGTLADPRMKVIADLVDGRLGTKPLGAARLLLTYGEHKADADIVIHGPTGGRLHVTNRSTLDLGYPGVTRGLDLPQLGLDARLIADHFDLALLSGATREVRRVAGELSGSIVATGPVRAPRVAGQLEWTKGGLTLLGLGDYQGIHLKLHGDQDVVWIDDLSLASGDGNARLTARATRRDDRRYELQATASLDRFPIYGQGQVLARVSVDGSGRGDASAADLKASVRIGEAHVELTDAKQKDLASLQRPPEVVLVDRGRPLDRVEARKLSALADVLGGAEPAEDADGDDRGLAGAPGSSFQAHLAIDAPRNLWIRGKDASLELGLGPDFRMETGGKGGPEIYGVMIVRRGRIDVLGRRFDLQAQSRVRFVGPPSAPQLDVIAKYFNETENVTVLLTARGGLDKLTITVSSPDRPDLTEGQLYALIVTGRLQLGGNTAGSTGISGQAASLVGGIVAAQLQKALAKRLPLDVLTLQAGEGLTGSRLEAGTYLTTKLYAGYVGRVGANPALLQNRNAVHVEYQLSRRWSFDGEYGDVGTGTADLIWTKHY